MSLAPAVVASSLTAQNETAGAADFSITLAGASAAGLLLLSWVAVEKVNWAGPVAGNNGDAYTLVETHDYPSPFTAYGMRFCSCAASAGGSASTQSGTKSQGTSDEVTLAGLALSGGTVVSKSAVTRAANGAGATHTSGSVTTTGRALLVSVCSGTGDVNATAPTQTWPTGENGWTVLQSVARSSAAAPNGHVPLYLAVREVSAAGTYTVGVQTTINEGLMMLLYAVQV